MEYLRFKGWEKLQHYKDRNPPWIKLHNYILDDFYYCQLPDNTKAHLTNLMLLASRTNNEVPFNPEWIKPRISANTDINFDLLLKTDFIQIVDASKLQAIRSELDTNSVSSAEQSKKKREKYSKGETMKEKVTRMTDRSWFES